ncbi:MAG: hypothetical protein ACKODP_03780 [Actinomycetota bacterium]
MKRFLGGVVALLAASLVVAAPAGPVGAAALTYPTPFSYFPVCSTADQEFCIEKFEFTPTGGAKQDLSSTAASNQFTNPFLEVFVSQSYTGPSGAPSQGGVFPALSINYQYLPGGTWSGARPPTLDGIQDGAYRTVLRTGDYDPSYLFLTGKYDAYSVTKGADGYFTVDLTAKPTPTAGVVELNGSRAALDACEAGNWVTNCQSNSAYRRYILASFMMSSDSAQRELMRGTWVSTNASIFSLGRVDLVAGVFDVTAKGPHYVPTDFGVAGLTQENGRELAPAFFEMYVTLPSIAKMLSQVAGKEVTVEMAKQAIADPSKVFEGTIDEATAGQITEKLQQLTMTVGDAGLRVNFNLTHFSAPNPTLKVRTASAQQTLTTLLAGSAGGGSTSGGSTSGGTTTGGSTTAAPAGNSVKTTIKGIKATITVTLTAKGTFTVYRKVGTKLTVVKKVSGRKGTNTVVTGYLKGYSYVVKDAKGKTIAVRTTSVRFARFY